MHTLKQITHNWRGKGVSHYSSILASLVLYSSSSSPTFRFWLSSVAETLIQVFLTIWLDYGCSGFPAKTWTGSSMSRTQLLWFWHALISGTCHFNRLSVDSQTSHTLLTRSFFSLTNPLMLWALSTCLTLLQPYTQSQILQYSARGLLSVPHNNLQTFGNRTFSVADPTLWNSRNAPSLDSFKNHLKTHL